MPQYIVVDFITGLYLKHNMLDTGRLLRMWVEDMDCATSLTLAKARAEVHYLSEVSAPVKVCVHVVEVNN